jgi:hypothetical protein
MAWDDPSDVNPGDKITAELWNQYVKANQEWLLTLGGTIAAWVYNTTNILLDQLHEVSITFDSEEFDSGDFHSTVDNTNRLTAPEDGLYGLVACLKHSKTSVLMEIRLYKNGSEQIGAGIAGGMNATANVSGVAMAFVHLAEGDYVEVRAYSDQAGSEYAVASGKFGISAMIAKIGVYPS